MARKPDPRAVARSRMRAVAKARPEQLEQRRGFRMQAAEDDDRLVDIFLYGEIGESWFGASVTAADFVAELQDVKADRIRLHIHSPGGDTWEGLAILNALRQHKAEVTAIIDGLAASAASLIAMGADEVVMMANSELMIHDAWGFAVGDAALMREMADDLDRESDNIAAVYAAKAGGKVADWRETMRGESWYTPEEALDAGLIDRIQDGPSEEEADASRILGADAERSPMWDGLPYRFAARAEAPPPPSLHDDASHDTLTSDAPDGEASVADVATLREALGLGDDVSDEDVIAKAAEAVKAPEDSADDTSTVPDGAVIVDAAEFERLKANAEAGAEANARMRAEAKERFINSVMAAGKLAPANTALRETLEDRWDTDPAKAQALADSLTVVVNMGEVGYGTPTDRPDLDAQWKDWEAAAFPEVAKVRNQTGGR